MRGWCSASSAYAGNADIAQMLRLIEDGIPLAWSRQQHHLFPQW